MPKFKVTIEQKIEIVRMYSEGREGKSSLAKRYGIDKSTVREYIAIYNAQGEEGFINQGKNRVYSEEHKYQAIQAYKEGKGSTREIAAQFGLRSSHQLKEWIKMYNSGRGFRHRMSGGSRKKEARPTTVEERIQIAKDCIANGGNYGETALKYNVSYQQVYQWVKKFKEKGNAGLEDRRGKRLKDQTPRTREEELEIEIAKLKHELYMTRMERDVLKKLDEIVRRDAYRK
ncbi:MAG: transposase [Clostridia bacterium]|nr:transposase [Clostridia bacterium]